MVDGGIGVTVYTLTCVFPGADDQVVTYQWMKDNITIASARSETLTFSPLRLSHSGVYTCSVNVSSIYLNNIIQDTDTITVTVSSESFFAWVK